MPVHPRWRGEHPLHNHYLRLIPGSSPLARGTHRLRQRPRRGRSVHPRWRGEHVLKLPAVVSVLRFIPAGAGNTRWHENVRRYLFIPAGAGNTLIVSPAASAITVHPRWRGEHTKDAEKKEHPCGSSPLARGTRMCWVVCLRRVAVHPRWRGEHVTTIEQQAAEGGSSPLARGTPMTLETWQ